MENLFSLKVIRLSELSNIAYWLKPQEVIKLLSTCKKFWGFRHKNEIWMQVFEKKISEDINCRKSKKDSDLFIQDIVPTLDINNSSEVIW